MYIKLSELLKIYKYKQQDEYKLQTTKKKMIKTKEKQKIQIYKMKINNNFSMLTLNIFFFS